MNYFYYFVWYTFFYGTIFGLIIAVCFTIYCFLHLLSKCVSRIHQLNLEIEGHRLENNSLSRNRKDSPIIEVSTPNLARRAYTFLSRCLLTPYGENNFEKLWHQINANQRRVFIYDQRSETNEDANFKIMYALIKLQERSNKVFRIEEFLWDPIANDKRYARILIDSIISSYIPNANFFITISSTNFELEERLCYCGFQEANEADLDQLKLTKENEFDDRKTFILKPLRLGEKTEVNIDYQ